MIYETRLYQVVPGRMAEVLAWYGGPGAKIFARLGFHIAGAWTGSDPDHENEMTLLLAWESMEHRDLAFKALNGDPEFSESYKALHANGKAYGAVTKTFLRPTNFSPLT